MAVYAKAHVRAFTETIIRAAFSKTGIVPYNPDVVTTEGAGMFMGALIESAVAIFSVPSEVVLATIAVDAQGVWGGRSRE